MTRVIDLLLTGARQAVPVGGIFALGWQPPVAIAVYWIESVLLAAGAGKNIEITLGVFKGISQGMRAKPALQAL